MRKNIIKISSILLLAIFIYPVLAYSKNVKNSNRMAVEKFFGQEKKSDFKLSPDGNYISYIEYKNLNKNLMIQDIRKKNNFQLIYDTTDRISEYFWVNNTQLVLSKAPEGSRKYKIYTIDIINKKIKGLTGFSDTRSRIIFVNSQKGNEIMISTNKSEVYRININTGKKKLVYRGLKTSPRIYTYYADNSGDLRLARTYSGIKIFNSQKNDFENLMSLDLQERFIPKYFSKTISLFMLILLLLEIKLL